MKKFQSYLALIFLGECFLSPIQAFTTQHILPKYAPQYQHERTPDQPGHDKKIQYDHFLLPLGYPRNSKTLLGATRDGQSTSDSALKMSSDSVSSMTKTTVASTIEMKQQQQEEEEEPFHNPKIQRTFETFPWKYGGKTYTINYRVEGPTTGPPVLLIHGFGGNVGHFRHQFPALAAAGYRVYGVDMIGFGASDKPTEDMPYSIELFVQLLTDFMMFISPVQKWIVAGNSIGGLCSLGVAQALPECVQGVVLLNCSGGMSGFRYEDIPMVWRPLLWFVQKVLLGPRFGGTFFSRFKTRQNVESILKYQGVYRDASKVDDELLELLLEPSHDEGAEKVFLQTFGGPPGPTPESILPDLQCPVLALWGDSDPWTPVDGGAHPGNGFAQYTKDFDLVVLPGVGHCPHDEAPDQVHVHMIPWMNALTKNES